MEWLKTHLFSLLFFSWLSCQGDCSSLLVPKTQLEVRGDLSKGRENLLFRHLLPKQVFPVKEFPTVGHCKHFTFPITFCHQGQWSMVTRINRECELPQRWQQKTAKDSKAGNTNSCSACRSGNVTDSSINVKQRRWTNPSCWLWYSKSRCP